MDCPKCGSGECWRPDADVGVGTIYGPWGCPDCGWSEYPEYDRTAGINRASRGTPGWHIDQWGQATRVSAIADKCERFGIPRDVVEDAFRDTGGEG